MPLDLHLLRTSLLSISIRAFIILVSALHYSSYYPKAFSTAVRLLPGSVCLSLAGSALLKRSDRFSPLGVSAAGGVLHNLGQIALAALVLDSGYIFAYLPVLLLSGTVAGALVGLLAGILIQRTDVR